MVTCGTYQKAHFFNTPARLDAFRRLFFSCITEAKWDLHAWAIHSNHYHFIASSPEDPGSLRRMLSKRHTLSARDINAQDRQAGRKVGFQFFDSHITFTNSYLARLLSITHNFRKIPRGRGATRRDRPFEDLTESVAAHRAPPTIRK
jgi:putative transposase